MAIKSIRPVTVEDRLILSNSGNLSLFFVGIGSAFSKVHYQTNLLIIKGNDHLLIDCGTMAPFAFFNYKCPITTIKNLLITHSHADHIGGLEEVALMGRYVIRSKPNMVITEEYEEILWHNSLKGGIEFNERKKLEGLKFEDMFNIIRPVQAGDNPRTYWNADVGSINIKIYRTNHIPDNAKTWKDAFISYGTVIDNRILFTSDTKYDEDLIFGFLKEFPEIEVIFHDCQFYKGGVHAGYEELLALPPEIRSKMFLTHYGDNYSNFNPEKDGFLGFALQGTYYDFD